MKRSCLLISLTLAVAGAPSRAADPSGAAKLSPDEAEQIATDAYVFLYPLVTIDQTEKVLTNTVKPSGKKAPVNQFANLKEYPSASDHEVTAPNADTLYSTAFLDLSNQPMVLSHPDMGNRFYMFPILDAYTNVLKTPGAKENGGGAATYVITGPSWKGGALPKGATEIKSPTNTAWILGRTYSSGTKEDYAEVHKLQAQYRLRPLDATDAFQPPAGHVNPKLDSKKSVRDQVDALSGGDFFARGAALMGPNPPTAADKPIVERMAKLGLRPGQPFDASKLPAEVAAAIEAAPKAAQARIKAQLAKGTKVENGWMVATKVGRYGTDYDQRAFIAAIGLGANMPDQAIYPLAEKDGAGNKLGGANKYAIHFAAGQQPPVKGFWSITMYTPEMFFYANPLNRYTVSSRTDFHKNADGSIDVLVQHDKPASKEQQANWLPAPKGGFALMMRLYWPNEAKPSILDGSWKPPAVAPVQAAHAQR
ncbi:MAG TPA: DUF1254 domain-containing protein [Polyangia bacterium]|jgi:hypothetical protein|nr:DUF1254 domain-containing protein [Polyangia bacterium]